jgi:hypothetical protein
MYEALLGAAERAVAAMATTVEAGEGEDEGGGCSKDEEEGGEGEGDEWLQRAVAPPSESGLLPQVVEIHLRAGPFPLAWPVVVEVAKRVLAVAVAVAAAAAGRWVECVGRWVGGAGVLRGFSATFFVPLHTCTRTHARARTHTHNRSSLSLSPSPTNNTKQQRQ